MIRFYCHKTLLTPVCCSASKVKSVHRQFILHVDNIMKKNNIDQTKQYCFNFDSIMINICAKYFTFLQDEYTPVIFKPSRQGAS